MKNYTVSLTIDIIDCHDEEEAIKQFVEIINRNDYQTTAFIIKAKETL